MMNRVVGNQTMCKVGNPHRTIWRAGSQCRTCDYNSTSGLVSVLTTLLPVVTGGRRCGGLSITKTGCKEVSSDYYSIQMFLYTHLQENM